MIIFMYLINKYNKVGRKSCFFIVFILPLINGIGLRILLIGGRFVVADEKRLICTDCFTFSLWTTCNIKALLLLYGVFNYAENMRMNEIFMTDDHCIQGVSVVRVQTSRGDVGS